MEKKLRIERKILFQTMYNVDGDNFIDNFK